MAHEKRMYRLPPIEPADVAKPESYFTNSIGCVAGLMLVKTSSIAGEKIYSTAARPVVAVSAVTAVLQVVFMHCATSFFRPIDTTLMAMHPAVSVRNVKGWAKCCVPVSALFLSVKTSHQRAILLLDLSRFVASEVSATPSSNALRLTP